MIGIIFSSLIFPRFITKNNAINCETNADNKKERKEATTKRKYLIRGYCVINATRIICTRIFCLLFYRNYLYDNYQGEIYLSPKNRPINVNNISLFRFALKRRF